MTRHDEDERLTALLEQWFELQDLGQTPAIDELCRDDPELAPALRALVNSAGPSQADDVLDSADPLLGRILGDRYRIVGRLGAGGMGLVYEAHDIPLDRSVAIKVLDDLFASDGERVARFRREAKSLAAQRHENIVAVHDVAIESRPPYLVMDRLYGVDLQRLITELATLSSDRVPKAATVADVWTRVGFVEHADALLRPWPELIARFGLQMARAVDSAHGAGVIHRDIKPSNFMLDESGRILLLDFGLAQRDHDVRLTRTGTTIGTPAYLSPEAVAGKTVDERSDVYSLGATLYEMLALRRPFEGSGRELETRILYDEPTPPSAVRSGTPSGLEAITLKALAKDPTRRYASAAALADDLQRFLDFEPVLATPRRLPRPLRRAVGTLRRHRPSPAVGVLLVAALGLTVWGLGSTLGILTADNELERRAQLERLVAGLPPGLSISGTPAERLRDPRRAALHEQLDAILALHATNGEATFHRWRMRMEEGRATDADRELAKRALGESFAPAVAALENLLRRDAGPAATRAALDAIRDDDSQLGYGFQMMIANELGEHRHARDIADLCAASFYASARTNYAHGVALLGLRRYTNETVEYLERAHDACPSDPAILLNLAKALRLTARPEEAKSVILRALEANPSHINYQHEYYLVLRDCREFDAAEEVLHSFPDAAADLRQLELGRLSLRRALQPSAAEKREQHLAQAEKLLRDLASREDQLTPRLRASMAASLARVGDDSLTVRDLVRQLDDDPRSVALQFQLGQQLVQSKRLRGVGRILLRIAHEAAPHDLTILGILARSYVTDAPAKGLELLRAYLRPESASELTEETRALLDALQSDRHRALWTDRLEKAGVLEAKHR